MKINDSIIAVFAEHQEAEQAIKKLAAAGFQMKNGAAFAWGDRYSHFDFGDTFSNGKPTTFQVQRASFDKLLADQAALQGVEIRYQEEIIAVDFDPVKPRLRVRREDGSEYSVFAYAVDVANNYVNYATQPSSAAPTK